MPWMGPGVQDAIKQQAAAKLTGQNLQNVFGGGGQAAAAAAPGFLSQASAFLANPWVGLGLTAGGAILDSVFDNPYDKARKQLVEERQQRLADLRRKARGNFTPAETQQTLNALEAITESVGQAGLEGSSVGQNVLAQSAQQAFLQQQQLATQGLNELEVSTYNMLSEFVTDDPGYGDLLSNVANFANYLQGQNRQDAALDAALKATEDLYNEFQTLFANQTGTGT